ncbi:hypothetical protein DIPPA_21442 [Diplonema papillatum]|nr:hypothetical protein DIPPA_21442 [Diplonema papillatum]
MAGPCLLALRVAAVALTVTVDVQPSQISLGQSAGVKVTGAGLSAADCARVVFTGDAAACNLTVGMSASDDICAMTIQPPTTAQFRTRALLYEGEYAVCYKAASEAEYSQVAGSEFAVVRTGPAVPPVVAGWDWEAAATATAPVVVELHFSGEGLSALRASADRVLVVKEDQLPLGTEGCDVPAGHYSVAVNATVDGPIQRSGLTRTRYSWDNPALNDARSARNYTICYAPCPGRSVNGTSADGCLPLEVVGRLEAPVRNEPPVVYMADDYFAARPCSEVAIFARPPSAGRAQEEMESPLGWHRQTVSVFIAYAPPPAAAPSADASCGNCSFREPEITEYHQLRHSFTGLGEYRFSLYAVDSGGTALDGSDTTAVYTFTLLIVGSNTAPVFEAVPHTSAVVGPSGGRIQSLPVVVGDVLAGTEPWEQHQDVYWVVTVVGGWSSYRSIFASNLAFNQSTRSIEATYAVNSRTLPVDVPLVLTAFDDLVVGPFNDPVCGESARRANLTIRVHPPNQPPRLGWIGDTTLLGYELFPFTAMRARPSVGPPHEVAVQTLLPPRIDIDLVSATFFAVKPNFTLDGQLTYTIAGNTLSSPPSSVSFNITLIDDGGTAEGGIDTVSVRLVIYIVEYYKLTVTPQQVALGSSLSAQVSGGLAYSAHEMYYVWTNSSGSTNVTDFVTRHSQVAADVVLLAGPRGRAPMASADLPVGTHTIFTLIFLDTSVDFDSLEAFGASACPSGSAVGVGYDGPCYLAEVVNVTLSSKPLADFLASATTAALDDKVPPTSGFAAVTLASKHIAALGRADTASSLRSSLANSILAVARRMSLASINVTDHVANGLVAIQSLTLPAPDEAAVVLPSSAMLAAITSLDIIAAFNYRLWQSCCSTAAVPAGCASHADCDASCCGARSSSNELLRLANGTMQAANALIDAAADAKAPEPWRSPDEKTAGLSDTSLASRRSSAQLMAMLVNTLHEQALDVCKAQLDAVDANGTVERGQGVRDPEPYTSALSAMTVHVSGSHRNASIFAPDTAFLASFADDGLAPIRVTVPRAAAMGGDGGPHVCRAFIAFFDVLLFSGNGDPAATPFMPVVSAKLTAVDAALAVSRAPQPASVPLSVSFAPRELSSLWTSYAVLQWNHSNAQWKPAGARVSRNASEVVVGGSFDLFSVPPSPSPLGRTAFQTAPPPTSATREYSRAAPARGFAALQSGTAALTAPVIGVSGFAPADDRCLACVVMPVFWGSFSVLLVLSVVWHSRDRRTYEAGSVPIEIDHRTDLVQLVAVTHMWLAVFSTLPQTLGFYNRTHRVVTLGTFFVSTLAIAGLFYENEQLVYSWEATYDWAKVLYGGLLTCFVAEFLAVLILVLFCSGPLRPSVVEKAKEADEGERRTQHKRMKYMPASQNRIRVRLAYFLFIVFGAGSTGLVFFLTSNYTQTAQDEQYLFTCVFAVLVQAFGIEPLRAVLLYRSGTCEGGTYDHSVVRTEAPSRSPQAPTTVDSESDANFGAETEARSQAPKDTQSVTRNGSLPPHGEIRLQPYSNYSTYSNPLCQSLPVPPLRQANPDLSLSLSTQHILNRSTLVRPAGQQPQPQPPVFYRSPKDTPTPRRSSFALPLSFDVDRATPVSPSLYDDAYSLLPSNEPSAIRRPMNSPLSDSYTPLDSRRGPTSPSRSWAGSGRGRGTHSVTSPQLTDVFSQFSSQY